MLHGDGINCRRDKLSAVLKLRQSTVLKWGWGDFRRYRRPRILRTVVEVCTSTSCMRHGIAKCASLLDIWSGRQLVFHPKCVFTGLLESRGFFSNRRISCSGRMSTLGLWGLNCEASCILHAPCAPHAHGPIRSAEGIVWVWQVPESHDGSSAPPSVPRGTCIRNSAKRGPLYYPLRSGTGLCHAVCFRRGPSKYSPTNRDSQDLSA